MEEQRFKAVVVWLIANGRTEEALDQLAKHYGVCTPKLKVGLPRRHKVTACGCYDAKTKTISVFHSSALKDPFVVLHEFYHHTRTGIDGKHRGTERYANEFAAEFIRAYQSCIWNASKLGKN